MIWFDEARLDDPVVLSAADLRLRALAESGSRVRREAAAAAEALEHAVTRASEAGRPRAVVTVGPDSRLLRAVLEPTCPVPFVAWSHPGLPGWAGSLDLVVVLSPDAGDPVVAGTVAEAVRRGCQVVVAAADGSLVADHVTGSSSTLLPVTTSDGLALAVTALSFLAQVGLGPATDAEEIATALDDVATLASPHRDLSSNAAKGLAVALADVTPVVWGGSALTARAARRVAEALRRASGRTALAGDADHLLPVIEAATPRDLFDDPFSDDGAVGDGVTAPRPALVILDDGAADPALIARRRALTEAADTHDVRVELLTAETDDAGSDLARYADLLLRGLYAAEYLRLGLVA